MLNDRETEEDIFLRQLENTMLNLSSKGLNGVRKGWVVAKDWDDRGRYLLGQLENTMLNLSGKEFNGVEKG